MTNRALPPDKADNLWNIFEQTLPQGDWTEEDLQSFRDTITPPPLLNSFAVIAENLPPILDLLTEVITLGTNHLPDNVEHIARWKSVCSAAISEKETLALHIPGFSRMWIEGEDPPFRNYYESHALGVALWCRVPNANQNRYRLAQAILIHAISEARNMAAVKGFSVSDQIAGAGLSIRKLARSQHDNVLTLLPESPVTVSRYMAILKELVTDNSHPLYSLFHLMEIASGQKNICSRSVHNLWGKHKGAASRTAVSYGFDSEDDGREGDVTSAQLLIDPVRKRANDHLVARALCHSGEFSGRNEGIVTTAKGKDPSGGRSRSQQYLAAKAMAERMAYENQMLSTDLDRLVPYEIVIFLRMLDEISTSNTDMSGICGRELAAFLAICFWTSRPPEEVIDCSEVPSVAVSRNKISIFRETDGSFHWVVFAEPTKLKLGVDKRIEQQALQIAKRYTLPFTTDAARTIESWLTSISLEKYAANSLFSRHLKEYETAIAEFFRFARKSCRGRQNFHRINIYFHDLLSRLPGSDVTLAIAVSGRSDKTGQVPHFYTAHSLDKIQSIYCNAVNHLWATYTRPSTISAPNVRGSADIYVGSRFVPRQKVIRDFVQSTRKSIAELRENHVKFEQVVKLHNIYTAYTVSLVGFATGYRAVTDPLFHDAEIDRVSGFAVISDKDRDDLYNSRIVWLPPVCLLQLDCYSRHLGVFRRWLFTHNQDLFFSSRKKSVSGLRADRRTPSLFFIDPEGKRLEVRPKHLESLLRLADYHLPANANRHYLRTTLLERGCPPEILNAFMGHWETGLEAWGRYSGLSPNVYRSELERILVPMLKDDGWDAEPGLRIG